MRRKDRRQKDVLEVGVEGLLERGVPPADAEFAVREKDMRNSRRGLSKRLPELFADAVAVLAVVVAATPGVE